MRKDGVEEKMVRGRESEKVADDVTGLGRS